MTAERKGIVDPWRVVEPFDKPKPEPLVQRKRINLNEVDFDADLRMPETCILKSKHGSIEIRSKQIRSADDGIRDLVHCLFEFLSKADEAPRMYGEANIAFSMKGHEWCMPKDGVAATHLQTAEGYSPAASLWFIDQTYDQGMLRLIHLLNAIHRRPSAAGAGILKRWGITPMLR